MEAEIDMEKGIKALRGKLIINGVLRLETGLHIGGSSEFAPIGAVDSPFIRDPLSKEPIIPGSSLKGKLRTLIARGLLPKGKYILNKVDDDQDIIQRIFGSSNKDTLSPARAQFVDIKLTADSKMRISSMDMDTYIGEIKFENTINRLNAQANPRQIERVPAGAEFDFKLIYNVEKEDEVIEDLALLADGFKLLQMDYLGGHGSRGYGRVSLSDITVDGFTIRQENEEKLNDLACKAAELLEGSCL